MLAGAALPPSSGASRNSDCTFLSRLGHPAMVTIMLRWLNSRLEAQAATPSRSRSTTGRTTSSRTGCAARDEGRVAAGTGGPRARSACCLAAVCARDGRAALTRAAAPRRTTSAWSRPCTTARASCLRRGCAHGAAPSRTCPALAARLSPGAACGRCVPAVRSSQGPPCSSGTRHTRRKPGRLWVGATVTGLGEHEVIYPHARAGPDRGGAGGRAARGGGAPGLVRAAPRPCLSPAPRAGAACGLCVPRWTGPVRAGGRALPSGHACC